MSRLDQAADRFETALERVESAAAVHGSRDQAARVRQLEAERESLLARIAELEDDMMALTGIATEVEDRLDGAIGEFRAALAR